MDKHQKEIITYQHQQEAEKFSSSAVQQEDAALKTAMTYFADVLLPYFGIQGKVVKIAPTELVHLDVQKLYQDFNLVMEDERWIHFEFQSTNEGKAGLKRFRVYEALTSYQYKVTVITYVLYSGTIKHPMTQFTEGINIYRVHPIIMQDKNADNIIANLKQKVETGEPLSREDLVPLTLCPLMSGDMTQKERIKTAFYITRSAASVSPEDIRKIEAVIYTMADKFLDSMSMEEILEDISMTKLGQKLINKGAEQGIELNKLENARNLIDLLDERVIAERIGLPLETVQKLKAESLASH